MFVVVAVLLVLVQVNLGHYAHKHPHTTACLHGNPVYTPKGILSCDPLHPTCPGYSTCEPVKGKPLGYCCRKAGCPLIKKRYCKGGRRHDRPCKNDLGCYKYEVCCNGPCGRICMKHDKKYTASAHSYHYYY